MKVLVVTNLFGFPWDPTRGLFNQQQFDRLAQRVDLTVLVAVPWLDALRRPRAYWNARREGRLSWKYVDYFIFWYPPGIARRLHAACFLVSLLLQRPRMTLRGGWHALLGSWAYPDAVATATIGRLSRTPVIMKVHGSDVNDYFEEPAKRRQILAAARRCGAIMCASAALRQRLVDGGIPAERVMVNYNGVDADRFQIRDRGAARRSLDLEPGGKLVLFVGNLKVAKGCVDLMRAFVRAAAIETRLTLVYIGDGEARAELESLVGQAGLAGRVRMPGKRPHVELPAWFGAADLLCLPSHNEGVPNVILESMACGVPVVATRVGGIPEVLPDFAGEQVDVGDVEALAAALLRVLGREWNPARIASHARQFSWDANVGRVQAILEGTCR